MKRYIVLFLIFSSCSIQSDEYKRLLNGTWHSDLEIVSLGGSVLVVSSTKTFFFDDVYVFEENNPTNGYINEEYTYKVGLKNQFPVYLLIDDTGAVVGDPVYFWFEKNNQILVTTTNNNQQNIRRWYK